MKTVKVLITGMGQVIGIGILKALRLTDLKCQIFGSDCNPESAGLYMVQEKCVLPNCVNEPDNYLAQITDYCVRKRIDILFLGSEPEVRFFAPIAEDFRKTTGTFVMVSLAQNIAWAMDKWETFQFLSHHNFPAPATLLPTPANIQAFSQKFGLPLIIKPRRGTASKGFQVINTLQQLSYQVQTSEDMVLQEYISPDNQEYTVGAFLTKPGHCHSLIILHRELVNGVTFRAKVVKDASISQLCCKLAESSGLVGPCNIQLRKSPRGPVVLEVNPRFSSTVAIRAHFGFNEPAMAIQQFIQHLKPAEPTLSSGVALRYWDEKYIDE